MLKLRILATAAAIIVIALSIYGLISGNDKSIPYTLFFLGVMLMIMGIVNIKEKWKLMGISSIVVSIFIFYVSVEGFL